jgi:hypothetical protein
MTNAIRSLARRSRLSAGAAAGVLGGLFLLTSAPVQSCNVPIFRYALERWLPDAYEVFVFHRGPLAPEFRVLANSLELTASNGLANLTLVTVDLAGDVPSPLNALWLAQTNATLPWLLVRYPPSAHAEQPVWAGPLHREAVQALVDSPARREMVRRLTQGDSAVWLLLGGKQKERDDAAADLLASESKKLEKSIRLPEAVPDDPQMRAEVPLKVAFSVVRVSREDSQERMLVRQLLEVDPDFRARTGPMVFAILGRGRALPPLSGAQISAEVLREVAEFIAGPCSCEVKAMNPGFDLLLAADWEALLEGRVVKEPEWPSLIGWSQFATPPTNRPAGSVAAADTSPIVERGRLRHNLFLLLGWGAGVLIVATLILRARAAKNAR